jgi:hypothetical protein
MEPQMHFYSSKPEPRTRPLSMDGPFCKLRYVLGALRSICRM